MQDSNMCCGGGGSFQFDFPGVSKGITENKIKNIRETGASVVVTGCPGCRVTIGGNMNDSDQITVLHPIQLVDLAITDKGPEESLPRAKLSRLWAMKMSPIELLTL
jgi:glycolate oxidase iron-sulfur subunit